MLNKHIPGVAVALLSQAVLSHAQGNQVLEEIVVTAQKREATIQSVSATVVAYDDSTLSNRSVIGLEDLQAIMPSAQIGQDAIGLELAIRGVSNGAGGAGDASVAFHNDGVYTLVPRNLFFDLERIEVIYGPQGTLYGRNATGGAMNVISRKPESDKLYGSLEQTVGNYSRSLTRGVLNIPLINDVLALRLAALSEDRQGYIINSTDGSSGGADADRYGVRLSLGYTPNDQLAVTVRATSNQIDGIGNSSVPATFIEVVDPLSNAVLAPLPADLALLTPYQIQENASNPFSFPFVDNGREVLDETAFSIDLQWQWDDKVLNYIGGINDSRSGGSRSAQTTATGVVGDIRDNNIDEYSHELRLTSNSDSDLQWLLGLFTYQSDRSTNVFLDLNGRDNVESIVVETLSDKATSHAAFASVSYQLTDKLKLKSGIRYSEDEKEIRQVTTTNLNPIIAALFGIPPTSVSTERNKADFDHVDGKIGADYQFSDAHLAYISLSTGYKAGGLNTSASSEPSFDEEVITALEIGSKNTFLNDSLLLNAALFSYQYDDYQVLTQDPLIFTDDNVSNADTVDFLGADITVQYAPGALTLTANVSYLDTEFSGGTQIYNSTLKREVDVSGLSLKKAPELSGNLEAAYEWTVPGGIINLRGNIYFSDDYTLGFTPLVNAQGRRVDVQDSYQRIDLSVTYEVDASGNLIELFVKNATDEEIITGFRGVNSGFTNFSYDPPRTYGMRFKVNF